jgi:ligand-binding sensor domain-containing protein/signal transduction histidine kinase
VNVASGWVSPSVSRAGWSWTVLGLLLALPVHAATPAAPPSFPFAESPPRFRHLSVEEGLRHSVVYSVRQDTAGFVWLATEGGLVRYDGNQLSHFESRPFGASSPSSQDASYVLQDRSGQLWIGTWGGGVERFDLTTEFFTRFEHREDDAASLSDDRVQTILESPDGSLWFGTYHGLGRFDPGAGTFTNYLHDPADPASLLSDRIWAIENDGNGGLWLGTDRGLLAFDPGSGRVSKAYRHDAADSTSLAHDEVRTLLRDRQGVVWVGTQAGLDRLESESGTFRHFAPRADDLTSLPDSIVNALFEDSRGGFWVGTQRGGLARFDRATGTSIVYRPDPVDRFSLSHKDVRALYEDRAGVLWVATRGGGVNLLDLQPSPFHLYVHRDNDPGSLATAAVLSTWKDADGTLWVGTLEGLDRIRGGQITHYRRRPGDPKALQSDQVQALHRDRSGRLWIGTYEGLCLLAADEVTFTCRRHVADDPQSLVNDRVQVILEDRAGALWIGTRRGLDRYDPASGVTRHYLREPERPDGLVDDFVWSLLEDRAGGIWVGTDVGGLAHLDPATGKVVTWRHEPDAPASLANNRVHTLIADRHTGGLWIGTRRGLDYLAPGGRELRHYGESEGLPSASIQGLLQDGGGILWLSSNRGLARFDPTTGQVLAFDPADGLQGWLYSRAAAIRADDGEMIFGGLDGLNRFYPEEVGDLSTPPALVLTGLTVANQPVTLPRAIAYTRRFELSYRDNFFVFQYAALDFMRPFRYQFQYRMVGFDRDWVAAGSRHEAVYTNVDPGEYTFEVRASGRPGQWAPPGVVVTVAVKPPFWRTYGFEALVAVALLAAAWGTHSWRLLRIGEERERLERLVGERTEEVERQRVQLAAVNDIVRLINAELALEPMLRAILSGVCALERADVGLALVLDRPTQRLLVRARHDGTDDTPLTGNVGVSDVDAYLAAAEELAPDVFLGPPALSPLVDRLLGPPRPARILALRVELEGRLAGFLIFARRASEAFAQETPTVLVDLRDHLVSAFVKGRMLEELRVLNATKNEFLGIAAHDLRSPLGGIIGYSDLLERLLAEGKFDGAKYGRFLTSIGRTARQMSALITNLLDVSAIESGKVELDLTRESLPALASERWSLHEGQAKAKGIALELIADEALAPLELDRTRIGEVIDNLLTNAIKFTAPGGRVRMLCGEQAGELQVHVEDSGPGLAAHELARVFAGGRLSPRPTAGEPSTGLGLVIVKKIVDLHGGRLWATSEPGVGSTFSFSLPRTRPTAT